MFMAPPSQRAGRSGMRASRQRSYGQPHRRVETRRIGKGTEEPESRGGSQLMQQLTSLDAQFLAIETPRTYGHVGGLAVYDPSTAPGGAVGCSKRSTR